MEPVTSEEALQYDKEALSTDIKKRKANIKIFEEAIAKENEGIDRDNQMIVIIEAHQKVKK
ncbi:MAG: hypothetical protein XU08_C0001G0163 [candidate division WWE3 bacterium CSP1-7]|uniref:Uncharacterized protein n=2 Tax=Katanobacteria TaxID=422282 RepID=A0A0T5ZY83_UNCKA|nr:MAG: hypothetical protein XU08_C0001G0163 [candidate division WWE3 bacterium CSP1-7]OGC59964.1 MAG: hypothetical protein A2890_02790 [candidate division WWE3 bacterium RIFCSPLOWO2_01_FULL_53_14]